MNKELKIKANNLPKHSGVYIMKNLNGDIIYIGKAKILKDRVSQYFNFSVKHSFRISTMISQIHDFDYIVTENEFEALVLECSLIKFHMPKYNILLKDDKGFSYIKITNENWPRILAVKQKIKDNAEYLGPFMNGQSIKKIVEETVKIFKIPVCNRNFMSSKTKPCLYFYINQCVAPCNKKIDNQKYLDLIKEAKFFIKNTNKATIKYLQKKMIDAAEVLLFEKAAEIRDKIKIIQHINFKQNVVSIKNEVQDVITFATDGKKFSIEVFKFSENKLYDTQNFLLEFTDDIVNVRTEFLKRYYMINETIPENIVIDGKIENFALIQKWLKKKSGKKIKILIPKKGEQLDILRMCKNNAFKFLDTANTTNFANVLESLSELLNIDKIPSYIEAYDISNFQGSYNVGGMIVIQNGYFLKSAYKKFKIKDVIGQNDCKSLEEIIRRRFEKYNLYKNTANYFGKLPNLLLIDGGIGQIHAVKNILTNYSLNIPIFGMVKNKKHKTEFLISETKKINIKRHEKVFNFIENIQNETHRYAIAYHKKLRDKNLVESELTKIKGIGKVRAKEILKHFKDLNNIAEASIEKLSEIPTITKECAKSIKSYFIALIPTNFTI